MGSVLYSSLKDLKRIDNENSPKNTYLHGLLQNSHPVFKRIFKIWLQKGLSFEESSERIMSILASHLNREDQI